MNNTTTIQEEYPLSFNVSEPIHKINDDTFSIIFNGMEFGLVKDDETMPDGLWEYVINLIKENPDIVTPMPEPEIPEMPDFEPIPEPKHNTHEFILGLMGVSDDE